MQKFLHDNITILNPMGYIFHIFNMAQPEVHVGYVQIIGIEKSILEF